MSKQLEIQIKRLDVLCDVVSSQLMTGKLSKATVRAFMSIAAKVVTEYYDEKERNAGTTVST